MFRLFSYLCVFLFVAIIASRIAALNGHVTLVAAGYEIETSLVVLVGAAILFTLVCKLAFSLISSVIFAPKTIQKVREERRYKASVNEISETLTAIAIGDSAKARRHLNKSTKLLTNTPLTHILSAQIAGIERNQDELKSSLESLLAHKSTALLAHRGLAEFHMRQGNIPNAIHYAEHALKKDPGNRQTGLNLISLHVKNSEWEKAHSVLRERKIKQGLGRAGTKLMNTKLALAESKEMQATGDPHAALDRAEIAYHLSPHFLPSALQLIKLYMVHKRVDSAKKLLASAWKEHPHPDLSALVFEIPGDDFDREKLINKLAKSYPHHHETHLLEARLAMETSQFAKAREHLKKALEAGKTRMAYKQMGKLELLEYHDQKLQNEWLEKAATLPRDALWKCDECGHELHEWSIHCDSCGAADSINWR